MTKFNDLGLDPALVRAVATQGYDTPTPIQAQAIPSLLSGHDLLGVAQTGTGKTAAFALPLLHRLAASAVRPAPGSIRALILAPTRELANQIGVALKTYGEGMRLRYAVVFGGAPMAPQIKFLRGGVDVLVATPGRLMDHFNSGRINLGQVETFILDEADRMLDMGFINDVRKVAGHLPAGHQTVLFSATMPKAVRTLAETLLNDPVTVQVAPQSTTAERVEQSVLFVQRGDKRLLLKSLLDDATVTRAVVFTRTKHGADRVAEQLARDGIDADAIHGNRTQSARSKVLGQFRRGALRVLVATDVAARGIDIDGVSHVINFELPEDAENYVHRIGRTARGGAAGKAMSFCDLEEKAYLQDIEKIIREPLPIFLDHPFHCETTAKAPVGPKPKRGGGGGGGRMAGGGQRPGAPRQRPAHGRPDASPDGDGPRSNKRAQNRHPAKSTSASDRGDGPGQGPGGKGGAPKNRSGKPGFGKPGFGKPGHGKPGRGRGFKAAA